MIRIVSEEQQGESKELKQFLNEISIGEREYFKKLSDFQKTFERNKDNFEVAEFREELIDAILKRLVSQEEKTNSEKMMPSHYWHYFHALSCLKVDKLSIEISKKDDSYIDRWWRNT